VIERPSKKHGALFQIRWRMNGGRWRHETVGPDRQEAERVLADRLTDATRGTHRERRTATFLEFTSDWFVSHGPRLKPSTHDTYKIVLEVHLLPFFGDYLVSQIDAELIERYVASKVEERKAGGALVVDLEAKARDARGDRRTSLERQLFDARRERGLGAASINRTLTRLRQVLSAAVKYGYIDSNPVDHVTRLKVPKRERPFLELDQVLPLLDATEERHRPLVWTLLLSGLRIGEALALRWGDVQLMSEPPRLHVRRTVYGGREGPVKTGEEGTVTFGPQLLQVLLDHKAGSSFTGDDHLVFCTRKGTHLNPSNVRRRILAPAVVRTNARLRLEDRALVAADLTPHSLRHTYASLLIAQGEDLPTVASQMRHADLGTTLKVYTHAMQHTRGGVAERLDAAIWGDRGSNPVAKTRLATTALDTARALDGSTLR